MSPNSALTDHGGLLARLSGVARVRDLAPTEDPATHLQRQLGDPRSAAQQFLQAYQPLAAGGVPKPPQVTPLARHLHPTLRQALQTASQRQAAGIQELNTCR